VKLIAVLLLCLSVNAYAAQEAGDTMTVTTDKGVCTVTIVIQAQDILADMKAPQSETFKKLVKRAQAQAEKAACLRIEELEAKEKAAREAAKPKKKADAERVWEVWELPGNWKCAGKDCSRLPAEVVEIPAEAR
jgi:hypothetical protein